MDGVTTSEGTRIAASTVLWAAGVTASPAAGWLHAEHDRVGRILVTENLSVPGHPSIFAIGDTVAAKWRENQLVPGIAPAAKQMGRYVGRHIAGSLSGSPSAPFRYRHAGDLAAIGRKSAVVSMGWLHLSGWPGWAIWGVAHIYFLIGTRNRIAVALAWLWDYLTFQKGARLIVDR
jgi:NADH dehydrogenase